jgi:hypothetical protein
MIKLESSAGVAITLIIGFSIVIAMNYLAGVGEWLLKDDRVDRLLTECELVDTRPLSDLFYFDQMSLENESGAFKCGELVRTGAIIPKNR